MAAVNDLCTNTLLLSDGKIKNIGKTSQIIDLYLGENSDTETNREWEDLENAPGNSQIKIRKIYSVNSENQMINYSLISEEVGIYIEYQVLEDIPYFTHGINVFTTSGIHIFTSHDNNPYEKDSIIKKGVYTTIVWIPANLLQDGDYLVNVACIRYNPFEILFHEENLIKIKLIDSNKNSARPEDYNLELPGLIRPKLNWGKRNQLYY
jgi:lipopolysaccharide transport system ATP-binding protein